MKQELFEELLASIKEGGEILRKEKQASRIIDIEEPNAKNIRNQLGLSQEKFSQMLGISSATLRNWEQGRRKPEGAARTLLYVAAMHPEAVLDTVHNLYAS
jgi:putative transcriptional regulator